MTETALVFPLLPGKHQALELFLAALQTERQAEHDRTHAGILEEKWYLQHSPQGDMMIICLKGTDPEAVFFDLAVSDAPFEVWFREQALELTGVDLSLVPPFCVPKCVFSRVRDGSI